MIYHEEHEVTDVTHCPRNADIKSLANYSKF